MNAYYLSAPQWQGSGKTNELYYGALALKNYISSIKDIVINEISVNEQDDLKLENNILGFSVLRGQLEALAAKLKKESPYKLAVIGGGCGIEVSIISYLARLHGNFNLYWFDAHGDMNSPLSSLSKHFHGMPLRFLTQRQYHEIDKLCELISTDNMALIGTRDLDLPEINYIAEHNIKTVSPERLSYFNADYLNSDNIKKAYIHIDLDVIDPSQYRNVKCPSGKGISINELENMVRLIAENKEVIGMGIFENTETDPENLKKLDKLIQYMLSI